MFEYVLLFCFFYNCMMQLLGRSIILWYSLATLIGILLYVERKIHQLVYLNLSSNNFSASLISQRIPIWWRWYYWANPVAWSLYGLLTSQYGGDTHLVKLSNGNSMTIREVLKHVFGYRHDFLCVTAVMVAGFCIFFAIIFAFAIKSFNFQRRWWDETC